MIDRSEVCATWPMAEHVVLDVDGRPHRIDHAEVDDRVDPDRHVVPGDAVLRGHRHRDDLHVDLLQPVETGTISDQAGLPDLRPYPPEPEHHAPLELPDHANAYRRRDQANDKCHEHHVKDDHSCSVGKGSAVSSPTTRRHNWLYGIPATNSRSAQSQ